MALEETFSKLVTKWHRAHDVVQALRITTVEDQPLEGGVLLIEHCAEATEDLVGWTSEGLAAAVEAAQSTAATPDLNSARRSLSASQQRFGRVEDLLREFSSYEPVNELTRFGRKQRGEWLGWVKSVKEAAAQCEGPIKELREALIDCWQELAERLGTMSVSVRTTNIGQQIAAGGAEIKESQRNGLT